MSRPADRANSAGPPDTAVLYDVADVARLARVPRATVARLCHAGEMPDWIELDGRRYWRYAEAVEAVIRASKERPDRRPAA
ncbi:MAG: helix-turn-helix domain-containing protein [bacterium]